MSKTCIIYDDLSLDLKIYKVGNSLDTKDYDVILKHKKNENVEFKVDYGLELFLEKDRKIELDPTTMEKIYRHNRELDDELLSKSIKKKNDILKKLENKINKLQNVLDFYKDNINKYLDSNEKEFIEYIKDEHNLYEDYDYYY